MHSKYYTPQISEFHVGFEYEELIGGEWQSDVFEPNVYSDDRMMFDDGWLDDDIRVKYLDQADVESLGFEEDYDDGKGSRWFRLYDTKYRLCLCEHTKHNIWIVNDDEPSLDDTLFKGIIKNKSELKKVLNQIGYEQK